MIERLGAKGVLAVLVLAMVALALVLWYVGVFDPPHLYPVGI